jgi:hypothetical protein
MVDMGLSFTQIGVYITMLGAVAALAGAAIAGGVLKYFSRPAALIGFSIFKIMRINQFVKHIFSGKLLRERGLVERRGKGPRV